MKDKANHSRLLIWLFVFLLLLLAFGATVFLYGKRENERAPWLKAPQVAVNSFAHTGEF